MSSTDDFDYGDLLDADGIFRGTTSDLARLHRQAENEGIKRGLAAPPAGQPAASASDGLTDVQMLAKVLIRDGEAPERAYERAVNEPGLVQEMAQQIKDHRDWLATRETERRDAEFEASEQGRQQAAEEALREKRQRAAQLEAARAYVETKHEELGVPGDVSELDESYVLRLAGYLPTPDDGSNDPETNRRIAEGGE